jgi:hypothetical protein
MLVEAPPELIALRSDGHELGAIPAFASSRVDGCGEITISNVGTVPIALQRDVLAFDWWIRNLDRTLTAHGGNPNLLWSPAERELVVIDHNNAFDPAFDAARFADSHVFAGQIPSIFHDLIERVTIGNRLRDVLESLPEACETIPAAWWFADDEQTVPVDIDIASVRATLDRCTHQDFWDLPL